MGSGCQFLRSFGVGRQLQLCMVDSLRRAAGRYSGRASVGRAGHAANRRRAGGRIETPVPEHAKVSVVFSVTGRAVRRPIFKLAPCSRDKPVAGARGLAQSRARATLGRRSPAPRRRPNFDGWSCRRRGRRRRAPAWPASSVAAGGGGLGAPPNSRTSSLAPGTSSGFRLGVPRPRASGEWRQSGAGTCAQLEVRWRRSIQRARTARRRRLDDEEVPRRHLAPPASAPRRWLGVPT